MNLNYAFFFHRPGICKIISVNVIYVFTFADINSSKY